MKIVFISHCGVDDNSSIHIFSLAAELSRRGHGCTVLVPNAAKPSPLAPNVEVLSYADGNGAWLNLKPDLIHAWTPREIVRQPAAALAEKSGAALVVHMEDNERQIAADMLRIPYPLLRLLPDVFLHSLLPPDCVYPRRAGRFMAQARGYSCLIEALLEFKPPTIPGTVFWPGYPPGFADAQPANRAQFGLRGSDIVIVYTGNVHRSVAADVGALYGAIATLRSRNYPVRLVKTGKDFAPAGAGVETKDFLIDLGFVARAQLPALTAMADVLVQPGAPDKFNDYRFPGKLPEYLVSGRPVILPNSNIGKFLRDGEQALKLETGTSDEIAEKIERVIREPKLAARLGAASRKFALDNLDWAKAADRIETLYRQVSGGKINAA